MKTRNVRHKQYRRYIRYQERLPTDIRYLPILWGWVRFNGFSTDDVRLHDRWHIRQQ